MNPLDWQDVAALRVDGDIGRVVKHLARQAAEETAARRSRVLRYPDLAAKLTEPPLSYSKPEHWNGFVPPREYNGQINASPRRKALVELCAEAMRREQAEQKEAYSRP